MLESLNLSGLGSMSSESNESRADIFNRLSGELKGVDCPLCENRGYQAVEVNGSWELVRCRCMNQRESLARIRKSGLSDMVERMTFESFVTSRPWQSDMLKAVQKYVADPDGHWLMLSGSVGCGKTHLCVAACGALINAGVSVRYCLWSEAAPALKSLVGDDEAFRERFTPLKDVDLLYIDDFFKLAPSPADVRLAFQLLDARYRNSKLMTIISSERTIKEILSIDEALGSRIFERTKGHYIEITGRDKNWRLHS